MQQPGDTYESKQGVKVNQLSLRTGTGEPSWNFIYFHCHKTENTAVGIRHADSVASFIRKSWC
jgi:hypothetical protein